MFVKFDIDFPEYTIITPQTGFVFGVKGLTVAETDKLKNSITNPAQATEVINQTLFSALQTKPSNIKTYEDFVKLTTLRDRESLIYGMYISTYDEFIDNLSVDCSDCGHSNKIRPYLPDCLELTPWLGTQVMKEQYAFSNTIAGNSDPEMDKLVAQQETAKKLKKISKASMKERRKAAGIENDEGMILLDDFEEEKVTEEPEKEVILASEPDNPHSILDHRHEIILPKSGIKVTLKQPTIKDEQNAMRMTPFGTKKHTDLASEIMIIDEMAQYRKGESKPYMCASEPAHILAGYKQLPEKDKRFIFNAFKQQYSDYGIELKTQWDCMSCGIQNELNIDIVSQFFRMVVSPFSGDSES